MAFNGMTFPKSPRGPNEEPIRRFERDFRKFKKKKKGPTALARQRKRVKLTAAEIAEKDVVRERDKRCRFPKCGCKRFDFGMKCWPTVSHDMHKGMGGDPQGKVSIACLMILLCKWRHQDAPVSRHAMTMRTRYLTPDQNDGPVAFEVDLWAVRPGMYQQRGVWFEVARESDVGLLMPLTEEQEHVLDELAEMER